MATWLFLFGQVVVATGAAAHEMPGDLVLVSESADGEPGNGSSSYGVSTSGDGRYIAFASVATNLDPLDTDNVVDVFVKDLSTGQLSLVSQTAGGVKGNAISNRPSISADGHQVAFESASDNLSPDDPDGFPDVFVKNMQTGELVLASRATDGMKAEGGAWSAALSPDGSAVAFVSKATNLSPAATDAKAHVYVERLEGGSLTLADGGAFDRPDEQAGASDPSLSADGRVVAFTTDASGLDPADNDLRSDVYVRNLGADKPRLVSATADGVKGEFPAGSPSLSGDGTLVAFETSSAFVAEDSDQETDIYVKSLVDESLQLGSTDAAGIKANRSAGYPSLSTDGTELAFSTDATNLGIDTPPLVKQVYRKNLVSGELLLASVTADGIPGDYLSIEPSIAGDGGVIAFYSPSTNLVADGGNRVADVMAKLFTESAPSDSVSPTAQIQTLPSRLPANRGIQPVLLTGFAADEGGIASVSFSVTDEYGEVQPNLDSEDAGGKTSYSWQRQVELSTTLHRGDCARVYTIAATVTDIAGNATTESTEVVVGWRTSWHN